MSLRANGKMKAKCKLSYLVTLYCFVFELHYAVLEGRVRVKKSIVPLRYCHSTCPSDTVEKKICILRFYFVK